jgi:hypothetical protein
MLAQLTNNAHMADTSQHLTKKDPATDLLAKKEAGIKCNKKREMKCKGYLQWAPKKWQSGE